MLEFLHMAGEMWSYFKGSRATWSSLPPYWAAQIYTSFPSQKYILDILFKIYTPGYTFIYENKEIIHFFRLGIEKSHLGPVPRSYVRSSRRISGVRFY